MPVLQMTDIIDSWVKDKSEIILSKKKCSPVTLGSPIGFVYKHQQMPTVVFRMMFVCNFIGYKLRTSKFDCSAPYLVKWKVAFIQSLLPAPVCIPEVLLAQSGLPLIFDCLLSLFKVPKVLQTTDFMNLWVEEAWKNSYSYPNLITNGYYISPM